MSFSPDTTVTPFEESILQIVGQFTLSNVADLIILTVFYGIFIPLFTVSLFMMIRRGLRTRADWATLIGTSINFAIITVDWIMTLTWLIYTIQIFLSHNENLPLEDRLFLELETENRFLIPLDTLGSVPLLISDAFVVWRASVLITRKWAMTIPIICLGCTVGFFIAATVVSSRSLAGIVVNWAISGLSLATNLISTGMIGWHLWYYRKQVLPSLGETKSPVYRIIITLIESGTIFCSIQIISLIVQILSVDLTSQSPPIAITATLQVMYSLAALYPTFIVLICRNQSSHIDEVALSVGHDLQCAVASQSISVSELDFSQHSSHSSSREVKPKVGTGVL